MYFSAANKTVLFYQHYSLYYHRQEDLGERYCIEALTDIFCILKQSALEEIMFGIFNRSTRVDILGLTDIDPEQVYI